MKIERLKFLALVREMTVHRVPPSWLVVGSRVLDCSCAWKPDAEYVVRSWRRSKTCYTGIRVMLQRLTAPFFKRGREVDLSQLRMVQS